MFTDSQHDPTTARLDELTEWVKTLEAQINHPETYRKTQPHTEAVITSPVSMHMIDLSEFREKFNDKMWMLLEVIGKEGLSKFADIESVLAKRMPDAKINRQSVASQFRTAAKHLTKMRVLNEYTLRKVPITPQMLLYSLTDIGDRIFQDKFFVKPVESEMARIKRNYHSPEHGYGILSLQKVFVGSGRYKEVSVFNRKNENNPGSPYDYYPDIMCVPKNGSYIDYFEYDLGAVSLPDLIQKFKKMRNVTSCLNFVVQNRGILAKRILPKVDEIVKSHDHEFLRDTIIRLTTPRMLLDNKADRNSWLVVYDTKKSLDPVINKIVL